MKRFDAGGLDLAYWDDGDGIPLLCLAGLTRDRRDFEYVAPHLSGVRLIRLDSRGRGASDRADPSTYTVPQEAADAVALLDHLGLDTAAILGTSRGGFIAMWLAATAKDRLRGVCLNDIGPVIDTAGLDVIKGYIGRRPTVKTLEEASAIRPYIMEGFEDVPAERWRSEVEHFFVETEDGLDLTYDPRLREAVEASGAQPSPDLWPLFDALEGLPLGIIRGANSDLLSHATYAEMLRRRPDAVAAEVPKRGHVPFLDEAESLSVIHRWLELL